MKTKMLHAASLTGLCLALAMQAGSAMGVIQITDVYIRATAPGQSNSAAYMVIHNMEPRVHALVAAESPAAQVVEMHTHALEGGLMHMRRVERIDLPTGRDVSLQPGGLHLMFIGLKHVLVPGTQESLTLIYDDGSRQTLHAQVRAVKTATAH